MLCTERVANYGKVTEENDVSPLNKEQGATSNSTAVTWERLKVNTSSKNAK